MIWMKLEVPGRVENWAFPPCWKKHEKDTFVLTLRDAHRKEGVDSFWLWILLISFNLWTTNLVWTIFQFLHSEDARHESSKLHQIHECQVVLVDVENASDIVSFYQLPSMCSSLRLSFSVCLAKQRNGHDLINGSWRRDVFEIVYQNDWAVFGR